MRSSLVRALVVAATGLTLAACSSTGQSGYPFATASSATPQSTTTSNATQTPTGSEAMASADATPPPLGVSPEAERGLLGNDPNDDLSIGKKQYRAHNYGLAERHFQHAAELHPRDAEAWLGLAASYDQLRRFDLADRAYAQAIRIVGPTAEILNNQGYSYMLRGDYRHARVKLKAAQRLEPNNKFIANNLRLLEKSARLGKAIE
jgi:tetratricopeptide (TPR) repeat protein